MRATTLRAKEDEMRGQTFHGRGRPRHQAKKDMCPTCGKKGLSPWRYYLPALAYVRYCRYCQHTEHDLAGRSERPEQ